MVFGFCWPMSQRAIIVSWTARGRHSPRIWYLGVSAFWTRNMTATTIPCGYTVIQGPAVVTMKKMHLHAPRWFLRQNGFSHKKMISFTVSKKIFRTMKKYRKDYFNRKNSLDSRMHENSVFLQILKYFFEGEGPLMTAVKFVRTVLTLMPRGDVPRSSPSSWLSPVTTRLLSPYNPVPNVMVNGFGKNICLTSCLLNGTKEQRTSWLQIWQSEQATRLDTSSHLDSEGDRKIGHPCCFPQIVSRHGRCQFWFCRFWKDVNSDSVDSGRMSIPLKVIRIL